MNDNEFHIEIAKLVSFVTFTLIIFIGGCTAHKREVLARMVESGADPQVAACALGDVDGIERSAVCGVVAVRK